MRNFDLPIELSKPAQQDLKDIWRGLAEYRLDLADRQIQRINQKMIRISQFPFSGKQRADIDPNVRSAVVDRFLVFYQILQRDDRSIIEILRVSDGRRNLDRLFNPEEPEDDELEES